MKRERCRACGATIVMIRRAESGRVIPAQPVTKVMALQATLDGEGELADVYNAARETPFYISHFQTCPNAQRFSRKARAAEGGARSRG